MTFIQFYDSMELSAMARLKELHPERTELDENMTRLINKGAIFLDIKKPIKELIRENKVDIIHPAGYYNADHSKYKYC